MGDYKTRYKNAVFSRERIELDGKSFENCQFKDCLIILDRGETDIRGSSFSDCKLLLRGNAYTIGKIIKLFTGPRPLKVVDLDEPLFDKGAGNNSS
jgi:hypothetical protein